LTNVDSLQRLAPFLNDLYSGARDVGLGFAVPPPGLGSKVDFSSRFLIFCCLLLRSLRSS